MKNRIFLVQGFLFWLPSKISATILLVIPLFTATGPPVHVSGGDTQIHPLPERVAVYVVAYPGFSEPERDEVPDPEPPTTDGAWSEVISVSPPTVEG